MLGGVVSADHCFFGVILVKFKLLEVRAIREFPQRRWEVVRFTARGPVQQIKRPLTGRVARNPLY